MSQISPTPTRQAKKNNPNGTPRAADQVYETLKKEIISGAIGPGELLSENVIAQRFKISRTPVREAFNQLSCEGLTQVLPQRGHQVRTISFSEVMEAFHLRELLEVEAIGEAARRITDQELEQLRGIMQGITDADDVLLKNYHFHSTIARISGNRLLAEYIEELLILMQRLLVHTPTLFDPNPELSIIEVLATRDPEAAREAMRAHLKDTRDQLVGIIRQGGDLSK